MKRSPEGKRLLIVYIMEILRQESDAAHPMRQREILARLEKKYGMRVERRAVSMNLDALREAGFPLRCREFERRVGKRKRLVRTGWYWEPELTPEEARAGLTALAGSPLPARDTRRLAKKLERLAGPFAISENPRVENLGDDEYRERLEKQEPALRVLLAAIKERKKASFCPRRIDVDGKWRRELRPDGEERRLKVNPYAVVAAAGQYFLLANPDGGETAEIYSVLRMADVTAEDTPRRPPESVPALERGVVPGDFLQSASRVFLGAPQVCTMELSPEAMTECVESFGRRVHLRAVTPRCLVVDVTAPISAVAVWALSHAGKARVTAPTLLVRQVKADIAALADLYGGL